jgi:hypothetical protein
MNFVTLVVCLILSLVHGFVEFEFDRHHEMARGSGISKPQDSRSEW